MYSNRMLEPRQIRAARALLDWSQTDLANAAGIALSSIKNIENDNSLARRETLTLIFRTLEQNGIEFMPGSGVRIANDVVNVVSGAHATAKLFDVLYDAAHQADPREICVMGVDEANAKQLDGHSLLQSHSDRLQEAGIRERLLVCEGNTEFLNEAAAYRWLPQSHFYRSAPIYIAGHKVAVHVGSLKRRAIIIDCKPLAHHLRMVFDFMWERSHAPEAAVPARTATIVRPSAGMIHSVGSPNQSAVSR